MKPSRCTPPSPREHSNETKNMIWSIPIWWISSVQNKTNKRPLASWISVLIFWVLFWSTADGWTIRGWELRFRSNMVALHCDRHLPLFPRVILPRSTTCAWHRHASTRRNCQAGFIQRHYAVHFPSTARSNPITNKLFFLFLFF